MAPDANRVLRSAIPKWNTSNMATVTLGVKVDEALRERLRVLADSLGCTPHWLHKQALLS